MKSAYLPRVVTQAFGFAFASSWPRTPGAEAEARAEVTAAGAEWAARFGDASPDAIVSLYAEEAVLLGTLSPALAEGRKAVRRYFAMAFEALPGHRVSFEEQHIRIYGDFAINDGFYVFSYVKDGQAGTLRARYSFVYRRSGGAWLIVDHHSSPVQTLPKLAGALP